MSKTKPLTRMFQTRRNGTIEPCDVLSMGPTMATVPDRHRVGGFARWAHEGRLHSTFGAAKAALVAELERDVEEYKGMLAGRLEALARAMTAEAPEVYTVRMLRGHVAYYLRQSGESFHWVDRADATTWPDRGELDAIRERFPLLGGQVVKVRP